LFQNLLIKIVYILTIEESGEVGERVGVTELGLFKPEVYAPIGRQIQLLYLCAIEDFF
jgi:hypothetical protein